MTSEDTAADAVERDDRVAGFWSGLARGALNGLAIVAVLLAVVAVVVPKVLGAVPLAVLTGSMEPTYSPGDLVVSQPVDVVDLQIGDVVTFQPSSGDPTLITHRVIGVQLGAGGVASLATQGDANGAVDDPILPEQVMGKVIYSVPYLGHVTQAVPDGTRGVLLVVIGSGLLLYCAYTLTIGRKRAQEPEVSR